MIARVRVGWRPVVLVPVLVGVGVRGGFQLYFGAFELIAGAPEGDHAVEIHPVALGFLFALGVLIGWGVLLGKRQPLRLIDGVFAAGLGVAAGLFPACELAFVLPRVILGPGS